MKTSRFLHFFAALFPPLFALTSVLAAGTPGAFDPLDRRLRLNLWGAGLKDVAVAVKEATGVDIVFYLPDLPAEENTDNVYLVTGDVPLSAVLETLACRFGFRFRLARTEQGGRVELSRSYGWVPAEPTLRFARMPRLSAPGGAPERERDFLDELLKPLPLLAGDFAVRVEPYPLPGNPDALRIAVALPGELAEYFVKSVDCLSGAPGDYPVRPESAVARARGEGVPDWEALLTRPVRQPGGGDVRAVLADVALQTGTVIALRAPPAGAGRGVFPPDVFRYTFGRICEVLSRDFELGRRVFLASGGVVFERGEEAAIETDPRSRELFWSGLAVAGFDAGEAVRRAGGADVLLAHIRREVFPGVWRDPVCSLLYSPVTERLSVTAPYNVIEKTAAFLSARNPRPQSD